MTPDERRRLHTNLDQHNEAARAFRESSDAFDQAMDAIRQTVAAVRAANEAQRDALDALIAANTAALTPAISLRGSHVARL